MKNLLILIALTISMVQISFAQLELRPFIGVNVSSLSDLDSVSFEPGTGINFGIDLMIGDRLYFQPGLHYQATKNEVDGPNQLENTITVNRIRIPLMVGYRLFDTESDGLLNVRVFTGPNISIVSNVDDEESQLSFSRDDFKDAVFGWTAGAGADFLFLFLDVAYQFGLSDVFDDLNIMGVNGENATNNMFFVQGGVRLKL